MTQTEVVVKAISIFIVRAARRIAALDDAQVETLRKLAEEYATANPSRREQIIDIALELLIP